MKYILFLKKKGFKVVMSRDYRFLRNIMLFVSLVVVYEYLQLQLCDMRFFMDEWLLYLLIFMVFW